MVRRTGSFRDWHPTPRRRRPRLAMSAIPPDRGDNPCCCRRPDRFTPDHHLQAAMAQQQSSRNDFYQSEANTFSERDSSSPQHRTHAAQPNTNTSCVNSTQVVTPLAGHVGLNQNHVGPMTTSTGCSNRVRNTTKRPKADQP